MSESINQIFKSAIIKYLSEVDCPKHGSNQYEMGGLVRSGFSRFLGEVVGSQRIPFATWIVRLEDEGDPIAVPSQAAWYNARNRVSEKRGPEYRLYYKSNDVTDLFHPEDFMMLAMTEDSRLLLITRPSSGSSRRSGRSRTTGRSSCSPWIRSRGPGTASGTRTSSSSCSRRRTDGMTV